jgi:hypothetical protein
MYYPALLILNNHVPLQLEESTLFKTVFFPNTDKEFTELWTIHKDNLHWNNQRLDQVFASNGYPVELMIIDEDGETLATHDQIGWWDEGEHTDDLRDITITDINRILKEHQGNIEIEISSNAYLINQIVPTLPEGKVILRIPIEEFDDEFDDLPDNEFKEED